MYSRNVLKYRVMIFLLYCPALNAIILNLLKKQQHKSKIWFKDNVNIQKARCF